MKIKNKLALGTVQWGMIYGITNNRGKPSSSEITDMLRYASQSGITLLDTAYGYGNAEIILGEQKQQTKHLQIVTKTTPVYEENFTKKGVDLVENGFQESLDRMQIEHVYGLLVHTIDSLIGLGGDLFWKGLQNIKNRGQVNKIGVSVYDPTQLEYILERYDIDLVQLPYSIYDQRFAKTGLLERLSKSNIEIHTRSAFLQGLLLLPGIKLPEKFKNIRSHHAELHKKFKDLGMSAVEACLGFCIENSAVDKVIIGCESIEQLKGIIEAANNYSDNVSELKPYFMDDELIINPSKWQ